MMKKYSRKKQMHAEINITPLVDVMLVLLIIFMVTAPMMTVGVPVDLPKIQGTSVSDQKEPIIVSMNKDGKIYLKEQELSIEEIINHLKDKPEERIFIRGDKNLSYGVIIEMMSKLSSAGLTRVSLMGEGQ